MSYTVEATAALSRENWRRPPPVRRSDDAAGPAVFGAAAAVGCSFTEMVGRPQHDDVAFVNAALWDDESPIGYQPR